MAVGKIEYKKILDDKNLTPTKLKDLYVSSLKNDNTFDGYNKHFVNDSSERYTIMTPEAAAAVIASRQQANALEQPVESDEEVVVDEEVTEEAPVQTQPTFTPIQGGIWPIVLDSEGNPTAPLVVPTDPIRYSNTGSFTDQSDFVEQMTNAYATELQRRGYNPAFAEYLVAQDALESGWGKHQSGKNNFGGIKGKGSTRQTKEWDGQKMITITDSFRDFDSLQDYVNYKINLVGNKNYNVFAYSPNQYFSRVKEGGYATDPNYVSKMNQMLNSVRAYS